MAKRKEPIDLILYKGKKNLTKQEIQERREQEVKAPADNVKPPAFLPNTMKRQFKRIAEQLIEIGIMTNLDSDALARYLMGQHHYENISLRLMELDPLDEDYETLLRHQDKFYKQSRSAAGDLGLTISSRCRLVMPTKKEEPKEPTKEEKLFGDV